METEFLVCAAKERRDWSEEKNRKNFKAKPKYIHILAMKENPSRKGQFKLIPMRWPIRHRPAYLEPTIAHKALYHIRVSLHMKFYSILRHCTGSILCEPRMWVVLGIVCRREIVQFLFFPAYLKPQSSKRYYCDRREKEQRKNASHSKLSSLHFTEDETLQRGKCSAFCVEKILFK